MQGGTFHACMAHQADTIFVTHDWKPQIDQYEVFQNKVKLLFCITFSNIKLYKENRKPKIRFLI